MSGTYIIVILCGTLGLFGTVAWILRHEVRRHRRELTMRDRLLEQSRPILLGSTCARCGGQFSTWDGGLRPLPAGRHVVPVPIRSRPVVEYQARRECLGCRHPLVLWLWSDGENWGFAEVTNDDE